MYYMTIKRLLGLVLILVSIQVFGQNPTNYVLRSTRERVISSMVDSMFRIPRYGGTPSSVRVNETSAIDGAIAMDTTNHRMYIFSGNAWVRVANYSEVGFPNSNVGSAYRLAIPNTNNIKTLSAGYSSILDSATTNQIGFKVDSSSSGLSAYYLRRKDSLTSTNTLGYVTKKILADTASAIRSAIPAATSPAGNYGNLQINRNGLFATPASDSLAYTAAGGLAVKNNITTTVGATFNTSNSSTGDINIKGQTDNNLLFADVSQDNIGIGTGTPSSSYKLDVNGTGRFTKLGIGTSPDLTTYSFDATGVNRMYQTYVTGFLDLRSSAYIQFYSGAFIKPYQQQLSVIRSYPTVTPGTLVLDNDVVGGSPTASTYKIIQNKFSGTEVSYMTGDGGAYFSGSVGIGTTSPNSTLNINGSFAKTYVSKAVDYTATSSDCVIDVTATGKTITLPTAVGITGRQYTIKLTASGTGTVATTSSQTIDGSTTYSLSAQYKYVSVISNGSNWIIIANN